MSSNHQLKVKRWGKDQYKAVCACRAESPAHDYRKEVEDWHAAHMRVVTRARAALSTRTPSLKQQLAYYLRMAEEAPRSDRPLWQQLADELAGQIERNDPHRGMSPLF